MWLPGEVEQLLQDSVVDAWADKPAAISAQAHAEAHPHNTTAYAHAPILVAV